MLLDLSKYKDRYEKVKKEDLERFKDNIEMIRYINEHKFYEEKPGIYYSGLNDMFSYYYKFEINEFDSFYVRDNDKKINWEKTYNKYGEDTYLSNYGVCDNYKQILEQYPFIETDDRKFIIALIPISKKHQSEHGGWRWHKWGKYIGTQTPICEYIYDEPEIDLVYVYHIYEVISGF